MHHDLQSVPKPTGGIASRGQHEAANRRFPQRDTIWIMRNTGNLKMSASRSGSELGVRTRKSVLNRAILTLSVVKLRFQTVARLRARNRPETAVHWLKH